MIYNGSQFGVRNNHDTLKHGEITNDIFNDMLIYRMLLTYSSKFLGDLMLYVFFYLHDHLQFRNVVTFIFFQSIHSQVDTGMNTYGFLKQFIFVINV